MTKYSREEIVVIFCMEFSESWKFKHMLWIVYSRFECCDLNFREVHINFSKAMHRSAFIFSPCFRNENGYVHMFFENYHEWISSNISKTKRTFTEVGAPSRNSRSWLFKPGVTNRWTHFCGSLNRTSLQGLCQRMSDQFWSVAPVPT